MYCLCMTIAKTLIRPFKCTSVLLSYFTLLAVLVSAEQWHALYANDACALLSSQLVSLAAMLITITA